MNRAHNETREAKTRRGHVNGDDYVSRPLPTGRACMPLDMFPLDAQANIIRQVIAETPPPEWIRLEGGAQIRSRAWCEWYWHRGIDVDKRRHRLPPPLRAFVIARDGHVCRLCDGPVAPDDIHIDHIIPWAHGGTDAASNLQVTHSLCNARKGARTHVP